jgi:GNAT superfamily N-acetyltransferase
MQRRASDVLERGGAARASLLVPDAADLAPGDAWAAALDWSDVAVHRVLSAGDARFATAYAALWREFGARDEMEQRAVIAARLDWHPERPVGGCALLYEMLLVERAGRTIAVRDHTAIVPLDDPAAPAVVHLSHALVVPEARGGGVGAWLRALPLATARACMALAGAGPRRVTLVAEMEPYDAAQAERTARLRIYGRAGFRAVDPEAVRYLQPDFRAPATIDASALAPLPLTLVVRRVGAEHEDALPGAEVRGIWHALYTMYGAHQRAGDMAPLWPRIAALPAAASVRLLPCTP